MGLFGRSSKAGGRRIRILFATDLHGSEYTFGKLLNALELWKPDVYVAGGDVAGKALLPVLVDEGRARVRWMGEEHDVATAELDGFEAKANQLGYYPCRTDADGLERLRTDSAYQTQVFDELMVDRWASWLDRLEERCGQLRIPTYVIAGNDDPWALDAPSFAEREWVHGADGKVLPLLDDWTLVSCGLANQTPWGCPRDTPEEVLAVRLADLWSGVDEGALVVANIHVPPYGSSLDIAPELDTSTDPPRAIAGSTKPVGSTAVAEFLRERQPLLSLHGHIHESPGAVNIGRTRSINPGSEYAEGILRAVLVTIERDRVVGQQFVTG